jgi:hypothetical protein
MAWVGKDAGVGCVAFGIRVMKTQPSRNQGQPEPVTVQATGGRASGDGIASGRQPGQQSSQLSDRPLVVLDDQARSWAKRLSARITKGRRNALPTGVVEA